MLVLVLIFAGVHSGLASFRDTGEKLIGERAYRVLFASTSLPLALTMIVSLFFHISCKKKTSIYTMIQLRYLFWAPNFLLGQLKLIQILN